MSCLVRVFSDEGARILFSETVTIPDVVNLHSPQRERTLRARVQWRRGDEIGLTFAEATPVAAAQEIELSKRVAQLEGEIITLQRLIKQLKREKAHESQIEAA